MPMFAQGQAHAHTHPWAEALISKQIMLFFCLKASPFTAEVIAPGRSELRQENTSKANKKAHYGER